MCPRGILAFIVALWASSMDSCINSYSTNSMKSVGPHEGSIGKKPALTFNLSLDRQTVRLAVAVVSIRKRRRLECRGSGRGAAGPPGWGGGGVWAAAGRRVSGQVHTSHRARREAAPESFLPVQYCTVLELDQIYSRFRVF